MTHRAALKRSQVPVTISSIYAYIIVYVYNTLIIDMYRNVLLF